MGKQEDGYKKQRARDDVHCEASFAQAAKLIVVRPKTSAIRGSGPCGYLGVLFLQLRGHAGPDADQLRANTRQARTLC